MLLDDMIIDRFLDRSPEPINGPRMRYDGEVLWTVCHDGEDIPMAVWWRDRPVVRADLDKIFMTHKNVSFDAAQMYGAILAMTFQAAVKRRNMKYLRWSGPISVQELEEAFLVALTRGLSLDAFESIHGRIAQDSQP